MAIMVRRLSKQNMVSSDGLVLSGSGGGIMHLAGFGESYRDWAWQAPEESVTPDRIDGENLVNDTRE